MDVYIVRHAIAIPREDPSGTDDAARDLTDKGVRRMQQVVRGLRRFGVRLGAIWTSPLIRARHTAELLAPLKEANGEIRIHDGLSPGGEPGQVIAELTQAGGAHCTALVGHEPDLGKLISKMLTGQAKSFIELKKGGVACVDLDLNGAHPRGRLNWVMTPGQLRRMK